MRIGRVERRLIGILSSQPKKYGTLKNEYLFRYGEYYDRSKPNTHDALLHKALSNLHKKRMINMSTEYRGKTYSLTDRGIELLTEWNMKKLLVKAINRVK